MRKKVEVQWALKYIHRERTKRELCLLHDASTILEVRRRSRCDEQSEHTYTHTQRDYKL
jgi:hypothetical protein